MVDAIANLGRADERDSAPEAPEAAGRAKRAARGVFRKYAEKRLLDKRREVEARSIRRGETDSSRAAANQMATAKKDQVLSAVAQAREQMARAGAGLEREQARRSEQGAQAYRRIGIEAAPHLQPRKEGIQGGPRGPISHADTRPRPQIGPRPPITHGDSFGQGPKGQMPSIPKGDPRSQPQVGPMPTKARGTNWCGTGQMREPTRAYQ